MFDTHLITLAVISNIFTCLLIKLYYQKKDLKSPTQYNVFLGFQTASSGLNARLSFNF